MHVCIYIYTYIYIYLFIYLFITYVYLYIYIQYIYIQNIGETYRIAENLMNIPFMRWFSKIWASLGPSQPSLGGLGVLDRAAQPRWAWCSGPWTSCWISTPRSISRVSWWPSDAGFYGATWVHGSPWTLAAPATTPSDGCCVSWIMWSIPEKTWSLKMSFIPLCVWCFFWDVRSPKKKLSFIYVSVSTFQKIGCSTPF